MRQSSKQGILSPKDPESALRRNPGISLGLTQWNSGTAAQAYYKTISRADQ